MFTKHTLLFAATVLLGGFSATMNAADFTYTNASTPSATAMDATFAAATYDNVTFNFTIGYFGTVANPSQTWVNNINIVNIATTAGAGSQSAYTTFTGTVTGTGPISMGSAANFQDLVFAGNMQGYSGAISLFGDGTSLVLGDPTSSVLQFGGVAVGGTVAAGVVTGTVPGTRFINNVAGTSALTSPNIIFNYSQDDSYDYLRVTNVFAVGRTLAFTGSANLSIASAIDGANAGVVQSGSGTVTLLGANQFGGPLTVSAGTLVLGVTNTLPSNCVVTVSGGTLDIGANTNTLASLSLVSGAVIGTTGSLTSAVFTAQSGSISATLSGSGALTKTTGGTLDLSGVQTFAGALSIEAGRVNLNTISMPAAINVIGGTLSGTGVSGGLLSMASGTSIALAGGLATAGITTNGVSFLGPVTLLFDTTPNGATTYDVLTYGAGGVTGFGNLSAPGYRGMLTDTGTMITFSLVSGTRTWNTTNGIWAIGGATTNFVEGDQKFFNGDTVIFGDISADSVVTLSGSLRPASVTVGNAANTYTFSGGTIDGTSALTKNGTGTLVLTSANSYTGVTTLAGGVVSISTLGDGGVAGNLGAASNAASNLVFNGGMLLYTGANASSDRGFTLQSGGGVIDVASADLTLSGTATGSGALTKAGPGTLTLSGTTTYTGGTIVSSGTLALAGSGTTGTGGLSVVSGATLDLSGATGTVTVANLAGAGAVTLGANTLSTGGDNTNTTYSGALAGTGGLTKTGTGRLTLSGTDRYTGATTISSGTLALAGATSLPSGALTDNGVLDISGLTSSGITLNSFSGTGAIVLGANTVTLGTANAVAVSGVISGTGGSVIKQGSGTLTLSGNNTYTGGTTVNAGTLAAGPGATNAFGSGTLVVNSPGTIDLGAGAVTVGGVSLAGGTIRNGTLTSEGAIATTAGTLSANLTGTGALTQSGSGTTTLSGNNSGFGGLIAVNGGTLIATTSSALGYGAVTVGSAGTLTANAAVTGIASLTLNGGTINGTGSITTAGAYTLNSGTVDIAITVGTGSVLNITAGNTFTTNAALTGFSGVTLDGGVIGGTGSISAAGFNTSSGTASAILAGPGMLTQSGSGTTTLSGQNTYTGGTIVSSGTLALAGSGTTGTGGLSVASGATLDLSGATGTVTVANLAGAGAVTLGANTLSTGGDNTNTTYSGALAGTGGLTKTGTGRLTLSGTDSYTGATTISSGTLALAGATSLPSGALTDNGVLDISGLTSSGITLNSFSGTGAIVLGANTVTLGTANAVAVSGVISGTGGSVIKQGSGTLTLSGNNTYTGGTTVNAGTLALTGSGTTGTGGLSVASGATLDLSGATGTVTAANLAGAGAVTLGANTLSTGGDNTNTTYSGALAGTGGLTKTGTGRLTLSGTDAYTGATTVTGGTLFVAAGSATGGTYASDSGATVQFDGNTALTGTLTGAGSYVFSGAGATKVSGATLDTAGAVTVDSGHTLDLGSSSPTAYTLGTLTIASGAKLFGGGVIHGNLINAGVVAPGDPAIMSVSSFVNNAGTVNITIAGKGVAGAVNGFDQIKYSGTATINGGTLNITLLGGFIPVAGESFVFLQGGASAPTGAFTTVNLPALPSTVTGSLVTVTDGLEYLISANSLPGFSPHSGLANFIAVLPANSGAFSALGMIGTGDGGVTLSHAVTAMSPIGFSSMDALVIDENRATGDFLRERARDSSNPSAPEGVWTTYAAAHGAISTWNNSANGGTFDENFFGAKAGLSNTVAPGLSVGLALGYDNGMAWFHDDAGRVLQNRGSLTAYVTDDLGGDGFVYGAITGGISEFDTRRDTIVGRENGTDHGSDFSATTGIGRAIALPDDCETTPYAGLTYTAAHFSSFSETAVAGAGADALNVAGRVTQSLRLRLGDDLARMIPFSGGRLRFAVGVAYEHEFLDNDTGIDAAFANGSGNFGVRGVTLSRNTLIAGPSVRWEIDAAQTVSAGYSYEYGFAGTNSNRFDVAYTVRF